MHVYDNNVVQFLELEISEANIVEKIETHVLCSITSFRKSCLYEIMWKNIVQAGETTDENMVHAHCMLDN